jgi:uncharacterized OB-fold protein
MKPEEKKAFEEKIATYVGRSAAPPSAGKDKVNAAMIRQWAEVMGDTTGLYSDQSIAKASGKDGVISPPAMLQAWVMEGFPMANNPVIDTQRELHQLFDDYGFTGVLGTNSRQENFRDIKLGETVKENTVISSISAQKATARGIGYFIETTTSYDDEYDKPIGKQIFRVLKFIPNDDNDATSSSNEDDSPKAATRIPSPRGPDNKWWWDAVDNGKVLIQRCKKCQTLRHPPRPMCGQCQSIEWDSIESSLEGEVYSFIEMHYPKFPGYPTPLLCAVIELSEGTRLVANIAGCNVDEVSIGMKVSGKVEQVDAATMLPQFYLA